MQCISLESVRFTQSSIAAIEEIRRIRKAWSALAKIIPSGVMLTIFAGNKPLHSAYNVSQTDFETLAKAMDSLPKIQRRVIRDIAVMQALERGGKEAKFWKGIANGCKIR